MKLEVFDPAMCCSTGVCGPNPNAALAPFAADLDWVAAQGVAVRRYNLGQEPGAFAEQLAVRALLQEQGEAALPVVVADGTVRSTGRYPARDELAAWVGLAASPKIPSAVITELAAIGAAIGSNCEMCLRYHYGEARKLGLTATEIAEAVRSAEAVKAVPAANIRVLAERLLGTEPATQQAHSALVNIDEIAGLESGAAGSCCGGDAAEPCCGDADNAEAVAAGPADRCC